MQGFYPRGCLLTARIVRQGQKIRLLRLCPQRVQGRQHLDSTLPLLTLYRHPTISGEDVKHIQDLRDVPWRLLQPCQRTLRRQRGRHGGLTHTATSSVEGLLDNPVSSHRICRGVLDGGQELQALACPLIVRPLLHEVHDRWSSQHHSDTDARTFLPVDAARVAACVECPGRWLAPHRPAAGL